ncbi:MAG: hypothetical protein SGJ17_03575 [Hyphomicrobiales bacterium]|nr:hypothetical protein [Hyphomicrobiales bacterium]
MVKLAAIILAAGVAFSASAANAQSYNRSGTVTGPYGGSGSFQGSGSCEGGVCSRSGSSEYTTGAGRAFSRESSGSCSGGPCSSTSTFTGPRGGTVTRNRSRSRH